MRQVSSNFVAPDITSGLKCTLLVRMIPGGQVVDAKVVKSSGNATFDRQAELAVRKASPLPVPDEPRLFQQMKEIQFEFDPGAM
jgi:colicin import membrane protein